MEVVAVVLQKLLKSRAITSAKLPKEPRPDPLNIHTTNGFLVAQRLTGGRGVTTQEGVRFDRSAVGVEGIHVRGNGLLLRVSSVAVNAVEIWVQPVSLKKSLVFKQKSDRRFSVLAERKGAQTIFVEGSDSFARTKRLEDLFKISLQIALPAKGIDAVFETGGEEFLKTVNDSQAWVVFGRKKKRHAMSGTAHSLGFGRVAKGTSRCAGAGGEGKGAVRGNPESAPGIFPSRNRAEQVPLSRRSTGVRGPSECHAGPSSIVSIEHAPNPPKERTFLAALSPGSRGGEHDAVGQTRER